MTPDLQNMMTYKGIHALCDVGKDGRLKATHYACCLVGGPNPLWGVWTVGGKFLRFHNGRQSIMDTYTHLTWRRVMARWKLQDDRNSDPAARRTILEHELGKKLPKQEEGKDEGSKEAVASPAAT